MSSPQIGLVRPSSLPFGSPSTRPLVLPQRRRPRAVADLRERPRRKVAYLSRRFTVGIAVAAIFLRLFVLRQAATSSSPWTAPPWPSGSSTRSGTSLGLLALTIVSYWLARRRCRPATASQTRLIRSADRASDDRTHEPRNVAENRALACPWPLSPRGREQWVRTRPAPEHAR